MRLCLLEVPRRFSNACATAWHKHEVSPLVMAIVVVVADDHHHVLPELHLAIRRRRVPFDGVHVIHLDAHPDLSFPRVDTDVVFRPDELYETLDESPSGIAEFLLPLVFAGHVNQITWIKSPWAWQMPIGSYRDLTIGKRTLDGRMGLNCALPHFVDEELYCSSDKLLQESTREWSLFVAELDNMEDNASAETLLQALEHAQAHSKAYILDIDLDYFSTWNPFRKELEETLDPADLDIVEQVFSKPTYKRSDIDITVEQRQSERKTFLAIVKEIQACQGTDSYLQNVVDRLEHLYPRDVNAPQLLNSFASIIEALDSEQFERLVIWAGPNMDLPHHESTNSEIAEQMERFQQFLVKHSLDREHPPALITIAKSSGDEFLPPHQAETVLEAALNVLEQVFGSIDVQVIEYEPAENDDM